MGFDQAARKLVEAVDLEAARDEREHRFVRAPAAAEYSVAELTAAAVFVICGDAEFGGQMCDVVEQFACPRRLDGACGTVDDIVRTAGEKPSAHRAVRGGCKGGGCLVAERPRCGERGVGYGHGPAFARRSHAEHRLDLRIPVELRDKRFEELTHGRMLARKLLAVGKAEPCATTAAVHDGARGPGVEALGGGFLGHGGVLRSGCSARYGTRAANARLGGFAQTIYLRFGRSGEHRFEAPCRRMSKHPGNLMVIGCTPSN